MRILSYIPRNRKAPVSHKVGEQDTHHFPETPKDHYRRIYFNAIDTVTQCIATRFEQEDFKIYLNTQEFLLTSFAASEPCDTELAEVVKMYSEEWDSFKLKGLLPLPQTAEPMGFDTSEFDVNDLVTFLKSLDSSRRKLLRRLERVFRSCSACETMKDYKEGYLIVWTNYTSSCSSIVGLYFKGTCDVISVTMATNKVHKGVL